MGKRMNMRAAGHPAAERPANGPQRIRVQFFAVPGDSNNDAALNELGKLQGIDITRRYCPPGAHEFFVMPYIKAEPGGEFFGLNDIQTFVLRRLPPNNPGGRP